MVKNGAKPSVTRSHLPAALGESSIEDKQSRSLQDLGANFVPPLGDDCRELVQLASDICGTPLSMVTLADAEHEWFTTSIGTQLIRVQANVTFCAHTLAHGSLLIVPDALEDERFRDNPFVTASPNVRFYAGVPLTGGGDSLLGALCVVDTVPRALTEAQSRALRTLARQVSLRIELQTKTKALENSVAENSKLSEALQQSNDMFQAFMSHGPFASYIKDHEGRMLFYSKNLAERFGISQEEWLGKKDHELWPAAMADAFRANDLEVVTTGQAIVEIEHSPGPDGSVTQWKSYKFPIRSGQGEAMIAGISLDMTADIEREQALSKALEENLALSRRLEAASRLSNAFFACSPNVATIKDAHGKYVAYNQHFAELFLVNGSDWLGRTAYETVSPLQAEMHRGHDERVLETGETSTETYSILDRYGNTRFYRATKFLLTSADAEPLVGTVAIDVSSDVEVEAQRAKMASSARMAALGLMAGGVAHEINNPLAIIQGSALSLLSALETDTPKKEALVRAATRIRQTTDRIAKIVRSMRTLSRDGSRDPFTGAFMAEIIDETLAICRERLKANDVELRVGPLDASLRLECQRTQIGQVLLNLVQNAFDAAMDGMTPRWIGLEMTNENNAVTVSVSDSGPGVPLTLRSQIMEPFFTTKDVGKGTGLGLSISRAILADHGGVLELGADDVNTRFFFRLPINQAERVHEA